ncbi:MULTISPECIES: TetR family transcriptional regulator [unclassified Micromonospora]|uniref:TetR family transcriptional regulator n=1 Tax=unclassified Micromonospora TaxID=2617518 RepID=UPI00332A933E
MRGTREQILDAASTLFSVHGYRATSMRRIAEEVGITKAALYYHFPGKEDILARLTEPLLDELDDALTGAETCHDPAVVRWRVVEGMLDVFLRHRRTLLMLVRDMTLLAQAPVAERFRAVMALANDLVAGPDRSLARRVRAAQAVAGLGDTVVLFADESPDQVRRHVLDGVRALLALPQPGVASASTQEGAAAGRPETLRRPRGRAGGRPAALGPDQVEQARQRYRSGESVDRIADLLGVSRATVYRCLKTVND